MFHFCSSCCDFIKVRLLVSGDMVLTGKVTFRVQKMTCVWSTLNRLLCLGCRRLDQCMRLCVPLYGSSTLALGDPCACTIIL